MIDTNHVPQEQASGRHEEPVWGPKPEPEPQPSRRRRAWYALVALGVATIAVVSAVVVSATPVPASESPPEWPSAQLPDAWVRATEPGGSPQPDGQPGGGAAAPGAPMGTLAAAPGSSVSAPSSTAPPSGSTAQPAVTSAAPTASSTDETINLLLDPDMEGRYLRWAPLGAATTVTKTSTARSGSNALSISTTATGDVVTGATASPNTIVTVAGQVYRATCWVRSAAVITAALRFQRYTVDGNLVGAPVASAPVRLTDSNRWYLLSLTFAPSGFGNPMPLTVYATGLAGTGASLMVDDCTLTSESASGGAA